MCGAEKVVVLILACLSVLPPICRVLLIKPYARVHADAQLSWTSSHCRRYEPVPQWPPSFFKCLSLFLDSSHFIFSFPVWPLYKSIEILDWLIYLLQRFNILPSFFCSLELFGQLFQQKLVKWLIIVASHVIFFFPFSFSGKNANGRPLSLFFWMFDKLMLFFSYSLTPITGPECKIGHF